MKYQLNILLDPHRVYPPDDIWAHHFPINGWAPVSTKSRHEALKYAQGLCEDGRLDLLAWEVEEEEKAAAAEEGGRAELYIRPE